MSEEAAKQAGVDRTERILLVLLGLIMLAACLFWNRISLHRSLHEPALASLIETVWSPIEALAGPIPDDGESTRERMKILTFFWALLPAMVTYLVALHRVVRRFPAGDRFAIRVTLGFAVAFRLVLAPFPPILETDLHRYLWDGAVLAHGANPYQFAPIEVTNITSPKFRADYYEPHEVEELKHVEAIRRHPRMAAHFERINHPTVPTIYPPASQVLFATAYILRAGSHEVYKLLVALVDLGIVGLLVLLLRRLERNPNWILLYAWSPLVLKEYANTGHHDVLATFFVALSVLVLTGEGARVSLGRRTAPRDAVAGALLGMGALAKLYPIALAAVLLRRLRVRGILAFSLVLGLGYAPFVAHTGTGTFDSLSQFATHWEFNSSAYAAFHQVLGWYVPERVPLPWMDALVTRWTGAAPPGPLVLELKVLAKAGCGLGMLVTALVLFLFPLRTPHQVVGNVLAMLAAVFLLSPVSDPWYFGWLMPWITLLPAAHWLYLSLSMFLYYLYFWSWDYLPNVRALEYYPFYTLLARDLVVRLPSWWAARREPPVVGSPDRPPEAS